MAVLNLFYCKSQSRKKRARYFKLGCILGLVAMFYLWTLESESERKLRIIKEENTDEFIIGVLENYKVVEVDLNEKSTPKYELFDKEIFEDFAKIKPELGQGGKNTTLPGDLWKSANGSEIRKKSAINRLLSEMISPNRSLPDAREDGCKGITYDTNLPDASVVIIFAEEDYSLLIRLIHSVINRTPPHLLQEIILIDDNSTKNKDLLGKLERYLATRFPKGKVRLFRVLQRAGLIRAKMIGAHFATGDVVAFLDGHCEVTDHWLEPLLQRIKENPKAAVIPIVDDIDPDTFEYYYMKDYFYIGGFNWDGHFAHLKIPAHEAGRKEFHYSPTLTPTMPGIATDPVETPFVTVVNKCCSVIGGLFAMDRKYFWQIGSYDPGMEIWGGENLEISFRIWQCGGSVERIPCSRAGHISKHFHTYDENPPKTVNLFEINLARLAEVWMDEYKELFYLARPTITAADVGNISARVEFRKRMNCKSFKWYLENVYKGKFQLSFDSKYYGQIKNNFTNFCLDNMQNWNTEYRLAAHDCNTMLSATQTFYLGYPDPNQRETESYLLRREYEVAKGSNSSSEIKMVEIENGRNETWKINDGQIIHEKTGKCLTINMDSKRAENIELITCNSSSPNQKWTINNFGRNKEFEY